MGGTGIPNNADLNNYKTPGNYYCSSYSAAITLLNCPAKNAFTMKIEYSTGVSAAYISQMIRQYDNGDTYYRRWNGDDGKDIWGSWVKFTTNTDLQTAIATGNTVRQCVNATTDSQTKKFLIGRPNDAPAFTASRALLTVTKYNTFTFLTLQSTFDEVFVAFLYENDTITSSIWKRIDNTVGNLATEGRLGLDYNSTTKILSLYLGSNRIGTINVN